MQATIQKIGNSKGMIIPSWIINQFELNERDIVNLEVSKEGIFIRPLKKEQTKEELFYSYALEKLKEAEEEDDGARADAINYLTQMIDELEAKNNA